MRFTVVGLHFHDKFISKTVTARAACLQKHLSPLIILEGMLGYYCRHSPCTFCFLGGSWKLILESPFQLAGTRARERDKDISIHGCGWHYLELPTILQSKILEHLESVQAL